MRILMCLCAVSALGCVAVAQGTAAEESEVKVVAQSPLDRTRFFSVIKGARKIEIQPVRQATGVATGCVIAYGHLIPPPYGFERKNKTLYINAVQVEPSMVRERSKTPPKVLPETAQNRYLKMEDTMAKAQRYYRVNYGQKTLGQLKSEIRDSVLHDTGVVSGAQWVGDTTLMIDWVEAGSVAMVFAPPTKLDKIVDAMSPAEQKRYKADVKSKAEKKAAETGKEFFHLVDSNYKRALTDGKCLVFTGDGQTAVAILNTKAIVEIMERSNLAYDARAELLHRNGLSYQAVLDILENFNSQEWQGVLK